MWICRCGTENRTRTTQCPSCKGPEDVEEVQGGLPFVLFGMGILIAIATVLIDDAYQIPALRHYEGSVLFLSMGFGFLIWARADQTRGVTSGLDETGPLLIKEKESPFCFWVYVGTYYAGGIFLIVCGVISFFAPNPLF